MVKKTGLGKGLESLMGEATAEVGAVASDAKLPLSAIKPNKNQPRQSFEAEPLAELADSIKQNGVLQPIIVRPVADRFQILAGHRRKRVCEILQFDHIPGIVYDCDESEATLLMLDSNLHQRQNLLPSEKAFAYKDEAGRAE